MQQTTSATEVGRAILIAMSLQMAEQDLQRERSRRRWLPVGLGVAVPLLVWFGFSSAGLPWVTIGPATLVFLVASVVWLVWAITSLLGKTRPRPKGWIVVALILAVTAAGVVVGFPTKARFAVSEPSFNSVVAKLGPPPAAVKDSDPVEVDCPSLVGLYAIDHCEVTDGGYLFFDPLGNALVDYAGFAYLPSGPELTSTGAFEVQEVIHLQGDWYAFAASW